MTFLKIMIFVFFGLLTSVSSQGATKTPDVSAQLNIIYREYLRGPKIAGLVSLDQKIRDLIDRPWRQSKQSHDGKQFRPEWSNIGISVGHYSDALQYSGKLLVEAHRMNPSSELRPFTLFATIMGERHELGEMPNVNVALQYLKEFPKGPFARDASIILGDFYSDLFKVIGRLQEKEPHDYKYDCFRKHVEHTDLAIQAVNARSLSISYYAKALANAPAGWAETVDVRKRLARMREGNSKLIDEMGWHFCAD